MELMTYVFYDIEKDRIRAKIADACLDYGLERLQYSVFIGPLSRNRREEIFARLQDLLGDHAGKLIMQPVCESDVRLCRQASAGRSAGRANADGAAAKDAKLAAPAGTRKDA
jgi:CRISPR-associated protein Cas2